MKMNLINETVECIKRNVYSESDIKWVGSKDGKYGMSWDTLLEIQVKEDEK